MRMVKSEPVAKKGGTTATVQAPERKTATTREALDQMETTNAALDQTVPSDRHATALAAPRDRLATR